MNVINAPVDGENARATYAPNIAPEITMPATTAAAAAVPKPISAKKLYKEKLLSSISNMYSPNAKVRVFVRLLDRLLTCEYVHLLILKYIHPVSLSYLLIHFIILLFNRMYTKGVITY